MCDQYRAIMTDLSVRGGLKGRIGAVCEAPKLERKLRHERSLRLRPELIVQLFASIPVFRLNESQLDDHTHQQILVGRTALPPESQHHRRRPKIGVLLTRIL